jgi:hypothetical protein
MSLIASTPATTADCACCATSCATRVTRAIGVCLRDVLRPAVPRDDAVRLAAFFDDVFFDDVLRDVAALRPAREEPRLEAAERPELAPRELLDAPRDDADFALLDFLPFALLLLALRDEALLPDFPRDFLALVAIDASPRRQWCKIHFDDSKNQAHP